jgi:hypothetical protein
MSKFSIVLIKKNNYNIAKNIEINDISIEKIKNDITEYVEFIDVSNTQEMMTKIVELVGLKEDQVGCTSLCHEDNNLVYQLCHFKDLITNNKKENLSCLATTLTTSKETVYNNSVLICSRIIEDNKCVPYSINMDDLCNLIYNKFVHKGIFLEADNSITEFKFRYSPFEKMMEEEIKNHQWVEVTIAGFVIKLYVEVIPKPDKINKLATKIKGDSYIKGNVYMTIESHDFNFMNFTKEILKKVLLTCEGPLDNRKLREGEGELKNRKKDKDNVIVMNSLCVLEKRYKEALKIKNEKKFVCKGCFRMRYSSYDEFKNDWKNHKKDCIKKNVETVNEKLLGEVRLLEHKDKIKKQEEYNKQQDKKAMMEYS